MLVTLLKHFLVLVRIAGHGAWTKYGNHVQLILEELGLQTSSNIFTCGDEVKVSVTSI